MGIKLKGLVYVCAAEVEISGSESEKDMYCKIQTFETWLVNRVKILTDITMKRPQLIT